MNPNKIIKWLGILFVIIGIVVFVCTTLGAIFWKEPFGVLFGVFFLAIFGGIGGFFAVLGHKNLHADDKVLEKGISYTGKIFSYGEDHSVTMNGRPLLSLVVRYFDSQGTIKEAIVNTGSINESTYPIGATVTIRISNGVSALVPGSVTATRIQGEENLLNPDFDPKGIYSSIGISCPGCGAGIVVPIGMSQLCPYCNRKVRVDEYGNVVE